MAMLNSQMVYIYTQGRDSWVDLHMYHNEIIPPYDTPDVLNPTIVYND